jgi:serine protease Do
MNTKTIASILTAGALSTAAIAQVQSKEMVVRRVEGDGPRTVKIGKAGGLPVEKEPVTFLGIETAPAGRTLAAQLGLPADTGLVVTRIIEGSPAAGLLKEHDIITKLDDQILVDVRQLSVLVRGHKEGDEVALKLYRGGKETTVKVKLGKHEVPKISAAGDGPVFHFFGGSDLPESMPFGQIPGMAREDIDHAMNLLGRQPLDAFFLQKPHVRVFGHAGEKGASAGGSTILDLADGNLVYSDENGSIEVNATKGQRELTVKDPKGRVTFKGPINNEEERQKLPPDVMARLDKIQNVDFSSEPGEDFEQEGAALDVPAKSKINHPLPAEPPPRLQSF